MTARACEGEEQDELHEARGLKTPPGVLQNPAQQGCCTVAAGGPSLSVPRLCDDDGLDSATSCLGSWAQSSAILAWEKEETEAAGTAEWVEIRDDMAGLPYFRNRRSRAVIWDPCLGRLCGARAALPLAPIQSCQDVDAASSLPPFSTLNDDMVDQGLTFLTSCWVPQSGPAGVSKRTTVR